MNSPEPDVVATAGAASGGPWRIAPRVAWIESGEEVLVLALRAPYDRLPYRLPGSAALIWLCLAEGMDLAGLIAELGDGQPERAGEIEAFVCHLEGERLVIPLHG